MIRMVDNPAHPSWRGQQIGLVMQALGRLQDRRAADVLARQLTHRALADQAVSALKLMGPIAQSAVLEYLFNEEPEVRQRARQLLADYGTRPFTVATEALNRLKSNDPEIQRAALAWFAEHPPDDDVQKAEGAKLLTGLLEDLSPRINTLTLRALKFWATPDSVTPLVAFARRHEKAPPGDETTRNNALLIDVLAQLPSAATAEALAFQLKDAAQRGKVVQALVKFGPVANDVVLLYINHPNPEVQKEARSLCRLLNISADRQLDQTLADLADGKKGRARIALEHLARLRPDEASRGKVSRALNAPLLDPDRGIREQALDAVTVWASKENTATLLKVLVNLQVEPRERSARSIEKVSAALIAIGPDAEAAVIPFLKSPEGVVRCEACRILAAVGSGDSVKALREASLAFSNDDFFLRQAQTAMEMIMARK
jgi:hypothetical protein